MNGIDGKYCPLINIAAVLGASPVAMAQVWLYHSSDLSEECQCPPRVLGALAQSVLHGGPCCSHSVFYLSYLWNRCHNERKLALLCVYYETKWYNYYHYVMSALLSWTGLSCYQASSPSQIENTWKKNPLYSSIADVPASSVVLHLEKSVLIYLHISYLVPERMEGALWK